MVRMYLTTHRDQFNVFLHIIIPVIVSLAFIWVRTRRSIRRILAAQVEPVHCARLGADRVCDPGCAQAPWIGGVAAQSHRDGGGDRSRRHRGVRRSAGGGVGDGVIAPRFRRVFLSLVLAGFSFVGLLPGVAEACTCNAACRSTTPLRVVTWGPQRLLELTAARNSRGHPRRCSRRPAPSLLVVGLSGAAVVAVARVGRPASWGVR